jgi:ketosteroid isomerase-like protein
VVGSLVDRRFEMAGARDVVDSGHEAFNAHDEGQIRALYADNVVLTAPGEVRLEGPDAATEYAMSWLRAFPDAKLTPHSILEDGDWAAVQFTFEGTHTETLASPDG